MQFPLQIMSEQQVGSAPASAAASAAASATSITDEQQRSGSIPGIGWCCFFLLVIDRVVNFGLSKKLSYPKLL